MPPSVFTSKVPCKTHLLKILSHVTRRAMPLPWSGTLPMPSKSIPRGYPRQRMQNMKMEVNSANAAHQPLCSRHSHADHTPLAGNQVALPPHNKRTSTRQQPISCAIHRRPPLPAALPARCRRGINTTDSRIILCEAKRKAITESPRYVIEALRSRP